MTATDVRPVPPARQNGEPQMTEQTTFDASDMSARVLIAPCGCLVGGDITMSGPRRWRAAGTTRVTGFCRTRAEADEDAARGYREEVRTVAEFRAARLCGDATWHTPGDRCPMPDAYPAGHGWTPPARSFGPARCKVLLTRYPCFYAREEHDPSLPPEDVDFSGRRRKARGAR